MVDMRNLLGIDLPRTTGDNLEGMPAELRGPLRDAFAAMDQNLREVINRIEINQTPEIDASQVISGTLNIARIPNIPAEKVEAGTFGLGNFVFRGHVDPATHQTYRLGASGLEWNEIWTKDFRSSTLHIGETAHALTAMDAAANFAQPSGYRTMADATSVINPAGGGNYYYWNVLARRDAGGGYAGIAVVHSSGRAWIGYNTNGASAPNWTELYSSASPQILFPNGTAAAPGMAPVGDPDAGMFRSANNVLGLATNGTEWATLNGAGTLSLKATGDGAIQLEFATERPWRFRQRGTAGSTRLALQSTSASKYFDIEAYDDTIIASFYTGTAASLEVFGDVIANV